MRPAGKFARTITAAILGYALFLGAPLNAQQIEPLDVESDPNGVDVFKGKIKIPLPELSVPAAPRIRFSHPQFTQPMLTGERVEVVVPTAGDSTQPRPNGFTNFQNTSGTGMLPTETQSVFLISTGNGGSVGFTCDEDCISQEGDGSNLFVTFGSQDMTFRLIEGGTGRNILYDVQLYEQGFPGYGEKFHFFPSEMTYPDGEVITYTYDTVVASGFIYRRLNEMSSSVGYSLKLSYANSQYDIGWNQVVSAEIVSHQAPSTPLAKYTYTYGAGGLQVSDMLGRVVTCAGCGNTTSAEAFVPALTTALPGESGANFVATASQRTYGSVTHSEFVTTVVNDGAQYNYSYEVGKDPWNKPTKVTVTGPEGFSRIVDIVDAGQKERPYIIRTINSEGLVTSYDYDVRLRVQRITFPELNSVSVQYDVSGNVTERRAVAKPGSQLPDLVQRAYYDTDIFCADISCFLPIWTENARGHRTDYTWGVHGGFLTKLDPADAQGKRALTKRTYTSTGPARVETEELCEADGSGNELNCGTASSFLKTITYFGDTSLPLTETTSAGDGSDPITVTYAYDAAGAGYLTMKDGPLPGTDDAVYYHYDTLGRKIWEVGPKGENGNRSATRTTYRNADDQVVKSEVGYTTDPANPAATFVRTSDTRTAYDARRLARALVAVDSNGAVVSRTNINYDSRNREHCRAVRMSSSSTSWNACLLGATGDEGPDRITRQIYDTESRVTKVVQGYGTTLQRDYATYEYSDNGKQTAMTDARGYRAEMRYDGFDRQTHWYFPHPQATGTINTADYEQYGYDANGNRTSLRKRDGSVITFSYDKLNRVTRKTVPERAGLDATHTRDVVYRYDIRGLQLGASFDTMWGEGLRTYYDTHGRVWKNAMYDGAGVYTDLHYTHDAAGNRTSLKFPDAQIFTYNYTSGGMFDTLLDPAGNELANYNYNNRNELEQVARYSSAPEQDFGYDDIGRLDSLGWANGAASNNVSWGFTRNAANQIRSEMQTNDAYSWDGHSDKTIDYAANGLNQYSDIEGTAFCYDANGNLTADQTYAYLYDVENRLVEMRARVGTTCPTAYTGELKAKLTYDPMGRLYTIQNFVAGEGQGKRKFLYDGDALVMESDAATGTRLSRHIHGPGEGVDDPLVSYEHAGTWIGHARFLYADARGSIVYRSNHTGSDTAIHTYDEFGVPGSDHEAFGRFQYTGQIWLPELGMQYYKARMYAPTLGRFMQTDPIGYTDNVNLYGYVANDPINGIDPTGQNCQNLTDEELDSLDCIDDGDDSNNSLPQSGDVIGTNLADMIVVQGERASNSSSCSGPKCLTDEKGDERFGVIDRFFNYREVTLGLVSFSGTRCGKPVAGLKIDPATFDGAWIAIHGHNKYFADGSRSNDAPGPGDTSILRAVGIPNYIVGRHSVSAVERSGGEYRVRLVEGRWTRAERAQTASLVKKWNTKGTGGCK